MLCLLYGLSFHGASGEARQDKVRGMTRRSLSPSQVMRHSSTYDPHEHQCHGTIGIPYVYSPPITTIDDLRIGTTLGTETFPSIPRT